MPTVAREDVVPVAYELLGISYRCYRWLLFRGHHYWSLIPLFGRPMLRLERLLGSACTHPPPLLSSALISFKNFSNFSFVSLFLSGFLLCFFWISALDNAKNWLFITPVRKLILSFNELFRLNLQSLLGTALLSNWLSFSPSFDIKLKPLGTYLKAQLYFSQVRLAQANFETKHLAASTILQPSWFTWPKQV